MSTASNGAARSGGAREKVIFQINTPVAITIERDPPSWPTEGNWGEQYMYFLAGDRIAFVEPEVHAQLTALGAADGETFTITKAKNGRMVEWSVIPGDVAAQAQRAITAPAPAPRPARSAPAATPAITARIEAAKAENAARPDAPAQRISGNIMQAALCAALEATHAAEAFAEGIGANYRATPDGVEKLAITIYIDITGGNGKKR